MQAVQPDASVQPIVIREALFPSWSPDGSSLAVERRGDVVVVSATTIEARVVAGSSMEEMTPRWSPDGHWIAYTNRNETPPGQAYQRGHATDLIIVRPDGTGRRSLTGGCGIEPATDASWFCLVNGEWSIPAGQARAPSLRVVSEKFPRAVRFAVNVTDGACHVYGMPIAVRS